MTHHQLQPAPSQAAIGGHPIHPMLVSYPLAFLSGVLASDIAYQQTQDPFWARASRTLLAAGMISGAAAASAGLWDYLVIPRARQDATGWGHSTGNALALTLSWVNWRRRSAAPRDGVGSTELALSAATAALLMVTGWLGGELSYRYQVGVMAGENPRDYQPSRQFNGQQAQPMPIPLQNSPQREPTNIPQPDLVW